MIGTCGTGRYSTTPLCVVQKQPRVASSSLFCLLHCGADAKDVLEIDPSLRLAKESVPRLEKLQNDKNERMKEEAIGEFHRRRVPTESAPKK